MAITGRRSNGTVPAPSVAELEARLARAERMITILLLVLNRDMTRNRNGAPGASYQQIMINEQRVTTHEEFAEIQSWTADHRSGR